MKKDEELRARNTLAMARTVSLKSCTALLQEEVQTDEDWQPSNYAIPKSWAPPPRRSVN